jgi:hypothetical protein
MSCFDADILHVWEKGFAGNTKLERLVTSSRWVLIFTTHFNASHIDPVVPQSFNPQGAEGRKPMMQAEITGPGDERMPTAESVYLASKSKI